MDDPYKGKLNENNLSRRMLLNENLKPTTLMLLRSDPDSPVERLKLIHLQCYVWLNVLKATLRLLNSESYGYKMVWWESTSTIYDK